MGAMNNYLARPLKEAGLLTAQQYEGLMAEQVSNSQSAWEQTARKTNLSEDEIALALSVHLRLPFVKLAQETIDSAAVKLIPEEIGVSRGCIAIARNEIKGHRPSLTVAMTNPGDLQTIQEVEFSTGCTIEPVVATRTAILDALSREYRTENWLDEFLSNVDDGKMKIMAEEEDEAVPLRAGSEKTPPVVKLLNLIIQQGLREQASDIHVEPLLNHMQVRGRVQGMLKQFMTVPKWLHEPVISRLKILAHLDITERRRPQDGRIKVAYADHDIDLRVSTLPTHFGEKAVLRILGSGMNVPTLTDLGMNSDELEVMQRAVSQPQGMILVTGPTGSGKTTTLYSLVCAKKNPQINIVTVEDPIEIQLAGINQVQVNSKAGLTFANSLRSILRQDPDVILIGEIRDLETAEIAINAAQTGHLLLSTLHTNSTVATIARLFDIGVDPFLVSASVNLIVAQRLMRRVCEHCRTTYTPEAEDLQRLHLEHSGITFQHGAGCDQCEGTGYSGRIAVYEQLHCNNKIRDLIARKASDNDLRRVAMEGGMIPLIDAAIAKVSSGLTTVEEVLRVIPTDDDDIPRCPRCRASIDPQFSTCPYCLFTLRTNCSKCEHEMRPEWKACPFCGTARPAVDVASSIITLPPPPHFPAELPAKPVEPAAERPKILIVDDDAIFRSVIASALEQLPQRPSIEQAEDGVDGLDVALRVKPDLVITDVNMPVADGFELCHKLRSDVQTAFIPILMLTGNRDEQMRTKGYLVGTDDYMNKPFAIPEFNARVARLLSRTYGF
jgi:type IV pilus assembly protein PilB